MRVPPCNVAILHLGSRLAEENLNIDLLAHGKIENITAAGIIGGNDNAQDGCAQK
jgi:hypothetical protein